MAKYPISPEGVTELEKLSADLLKHEAEVDESGKTLLLTISNLSEGLGVYYDDINDIVRITQQALYGAKEALYKLSIQLKSQSEIIAGLLAFSSNESTNNNFRSNMKLENWKINPAVGSSSGCNNSELAMMAMNQNIADHVDFGNLDVKVSQQLIQGISETRKLFPDLNLHMNFIGSIEARNQYVAGKASRDLLKYYANEYITQHPDCSMTDIKTYAKDKTQRQLSKLVPRGNVIAQSVSSDVINENTPMDDIILIKAAQGISVSEAIGSDYGNFWISKIQQVNSGFKPEGCDTPKATIDHELGHQIAHQVNAENDPYIKKAFEKFMTLSEEKRRSVLSGYAGKEGKIGEFIAESWSEYRNNPQCRKLAKNISYRMIQLYNSGHGQQGNMVKSIMGGDGRV